MFDPSAMQDQGPKLDPLEPTRKDSIAVCDQDFTDGSTPARRRPANPAENIETFSAAEVMRASHSQRLRMFSYAAKEHIDRNSPQPAPRLVAFAKRQPLIAHRDPLPINIKENFGMFQPLAPHLLKLMRWTVSRLSPEESR